MEAKIETKKVPVVKIHVNSEVDAAILLSLINLGNEDTLEFTKKVKELMDKDFPPVDDADVISLCENTVINKLVHLEISLEESFNSGNFVLNRS